MNGSPFILNFSIKGGPFISSHLVFECHCALSAIELATCEIDIRNEMQAIVDDNVANYYCNDNYNHEECNFDGGDCCLISASAIKNEDSVLLLCTIN